MFNAFWKVLKNASPRLCPRPAERRDRKYRKPETGRRNSVRVRLKMVGCWLKARLRRILHWTILPASSLRFPVCLLLPALCLAWLSIAAPAQDAGETDQAIRPGAQTIFIFVNQAREKVTEFIVRLARFRPDIVLEWENSIDQGTIHLFRSAVSQEEGFTLSRHFEVGVHSESADMMTLWLPDKVFDQLSRKGSVKMRYNNLPLKLKKEGRGTFRFRYNKRETEIPVILASDSRRGRWSIWDDPDNPLVVQYESPYFKQHLKTMAARNRPALRWIKKLPPIR